MDAKRLAEILDKELASKDGLLRLRPSWVARDFLKPGRRLGLSEKDMDVGKRGFICERWLASETETDNTVKHPNEGLSYLDIAGHDILLRDALASCAALLMGAAYAAKHHGLDRLAKIYDFDSRIFFHYHQMTEDARKLGHNSKEESYYFPTGVPLGPHPETFFGVHPYIVEQGKQYELLLPLLEKWEGDGILKFSRAYLNVQGEGFHLQAGLLHAPGTALTIELQESSDVMGVLQAEVEGVKQSKALLYKDIPPEEVAAKGERAALDQLQWEANGDPYFYENHHTAPVEIPGTDPALGGETWIYYDSTRYSGKRLVVKPGKSLTIKDLGVHNLLVWKGEGRVQKLRVAAGDFAADEILVSHDRAVAGVSYENTGSVDLEIIKFFGPDINSLVVPYLEKYQGRR
jgi:hypothetical protein